MSITIADERVANEMAQAGGPVAVFAGDGRILGVFTPTKEPDISDEELLRRLKDPNAKWYTAVEVEAKMREWQCSQ
jgi:hypothetical protein